MFNTRVVCFNEFFSTEYGDNLCCRHCGEFALNGAVVDHYTALKKFRLWYKRSMPVNSGYRCAAYNAQLEGASPKSQHLQGIATDIAYPAEFSSWSKSRKREFLSNIKAWWRAECRARGLGGGVGFYDDFFHLDSRPGEFAFWDFSPYFK